MAFMHEHKHEQPLDAAVCLVAWSLNKSTLPHNRLPREASTLFWCTIDHVLQESDLIVQGCLRVYLKLARRTVQIPTDPTFQIFAQLISIPQAVKGLTLPFC